MKNYQYFTILMFLSFILARVSVNDFETAIFTIIAVVFFIIGMIAWVKERKEE